MTNDIMYATEAVGVCAESGVSPITRVLLRSFGVFSAY